MKNLKEVILESLQVNEAISINWAKYDISQEDLDMRCEELGINYVIIPADKVTYKQNVTDWLLEMSDSVVEKPFDKEAKALLKSFNINPNNVEVFRHSAPDALNNDEIIIYTPAGGNTEGEDYDFAVEELFPVE